MDFEVFCFSFPVIVHLHQANCLEYLSHKNLFKWPYFDVPFVQLEGCKCFRNCIDFGWRRSFMFFFVIWFFFFPASSSYGGCQLVSTISSCGFGGILRQQKIYYLHWFKSTLNFLVSRILVLLYLLCQLKPANIGVTAFTWSNYKGSELFSLEILASQLHQSSCFTSFSHQNFLYFFCFLCVAFVDCQQSTDCIVSDRL